MNPDGLGRQPAANPSPPDLAPQASAFGPQSDPDSGGSPPQAAVDVSLPQSFMPPELRRNQSTAGVVRSPPTSNVIKSSPGFVFDGRDRPTMLPETRAPGVLPTPGLVDVAADSGSAPLASPGLSFAASADQSADCLIQTTRTDLKPSDARVEGSRPHISSKREVHLDPDAQRRVSDRCTQRRKNPKLIDFPTGAKTDWLDRLFQRTGRILIECRTQSETDRWRQAWFIGDVHGDLVGLLAALDFIQHQSEYSKESDVIVLLGDLIDDLPESESVLAEVSEALCAGERLIVIVGNHDDALEYSDNRGFGASVDPCDYCEYLKGIADSGREHRSLGFAQSFIRFMRDTPVALFLNDGTMAAHGGVPHKDLAEEVARGGWGEDHRIWRDFIWARLHPRAKSRMAVTGTRSRELGADDFRHFAAAVKSQLEFEPVRMIRGHDHIDARFEIYGGKWRDTVLTINNMSWKLPREAGLDGPRNPCIARWTRGEPIQPIVILMDPDWRARMQLGASA